jgi:hypothetical protein
MPIGFRPLANPTAPTASEWRMAHQLTVRQRAATTDGTQRAQLALERRPSGRHNEGIDGSELTAEVGRTRVARAGIVAAQIRRCVSTARGSEPADAREKLAPPEPNTHGPPPRRAQAAARSSRAGRARIVRDARGVPRPSTGEHGAEPDVWGRRDARRTRPDRPGCEGRSAAEHGTVGAPAGARLSEGLSAGALRCGFLRFG